MYVAKSRVLALLGELKHTMELQNKLEGADAVDKGIEMIDRLPVTANANRGRWQDTRKVAICDKCGFITLPYKMTPFCPNCGCRMENGDAKNGGVQE